MGIYTCSYTDATENDMQLTDQEIREILIRRKIQKKRRARRRRRMILIILILLIIAAVVIVKVIGHKGSSADTGEEEAAQAADTAPVIFIDPGHGGVDSGSETATRIEKDDTLRMSLAVRDALTSMGYNVDMSRTEDVDVDRTARGQMANKAGAALFVSIHRNKASTDGKGVEGFIPKSNDSASRMLGENILKALVDQGFTERTIRAGTLNSEDEDYEENAASTMPSVLIEVGFISSDEDNTLFDDHLDSNARAIARAINYTYLSLTDPDKAAAVQAEEQLAIDTADKAVDKVLTVGDTISLVSTFLSMDTYDGLDGESP